jgi:ABC-type antimicrobial peptide transport system permease subunit
MAVQSLWQRASRTVLTLGTIAITVGAIMALEGMVRGASTMVTNLGIGADVEIMIREANIADTSLSAIDVRIGDQIEALPDVESVSGMIMSAALMPESTGFFILWGYGPYEYAIRKFKVVEGNPLTGNHQLILGRMMADALNKGVGDTLELSGSRFRVTGIYETGVSWEELGGVVTLRDAQTFAGRPRKLTMLAVKTVDPLNAPEVVDIINTQFPKVQASLSGEFAEEMPDMKNADGMLDGISFLAIIVGGVGVLNTMLMSVFERTREIGVLRALGWRARGIMGLILQEALILGLLGGLAGIVVALGLTSAMQLAPMVGDVVSAEYSPDVFLRAISIALFLGLVGGLYPALRATRLEPVEAIRYE